MSHAELQRHHVHGQRPRQVRLVADHSCRLAIRSKTAAPQLPPSTACSVPCSRGCLAGLEQRSDTLSSN